MSRLTKEGYTRLIEENIQKIDEFIPLESLEAQHTKEVLKWSIGALYPTTEAVEGCHITNPTHRLPFMTAFTLLQEGCRIAREEWKNSYLFWLKASEVESFYIHTTELTQIVKQTGRNTLSMKAAIRKREEDGSVMTGWLPSLEDLLSNSWKVV